VTQLSLVDTEEDAIEQLHALTAIYTREHVVSDILDRVGWPRDGRLLDPSCGDGVFIVAALERLNTPPGDFESISMVQGWEIYSGAARDAHEQVKSLLVSRGWSPSSATLAAFKVVHRGDFLMQDVGRFSTLVGNPPYLRFGNLPEAFKSIYGHSVPGYAKADLLHAFLDRCCSILTTDGVVGFVTADRWLFNETAAGLREQLGHHVGLDHVQRLDPASSFYRPKRRTIGAPPRIHPVTIVLRPHGVRPIDRNPITTDNHVHSGPYLGDVAQIHLAPWVGPKGIFVVDKVTAKQFSLSDLVPCVDTDDIDPHSDKLREPSRYVIRIQQQPSGALRKHLLRNIERMPARGRRTDWWLPPESVMMDLSRPSLLIPRIAKRLRVIRLPAGILPINHNLQVVADDDLDNIERMLLSEQAQTWVARNAPRLENGYLSITTRLLRRLPVAGSY
jgi:hypothetical protein